MKGSHYLGFENVLTSAVFGRTPDSRRRFCRASVVVPGGRSDEKFAKGVRVSGEKLTGRPDELVTEKIAKKKTE